MPLATLMPGYQAVWEGEVERHGLRPHGFEALANWGFADLIFSLAWDDISSLVKLRRHGFAEAMDTEDMFLRLLGEFRRDRIIS